MLVSPPQMKNPEHSFVTIGHLAFFLVQDVLKSSAMYSFCISCGSDEGHKINYEWKWMFVIFVFCLKIKKKKTLTVTPCWLPVVLYIAVAHIVMCFTFMPVFQSNIGLDHPDPDYQCSKPTDRMA